MKLSKSYDQLKLNEEIQNHMRAIVSLSNGQHHWNRQKDATKNSLDFQIKYGVNLSKFIIVLQVIEATSRR